MAYLDLAKQVLNTLSGYEKNELNETIPPPSHAVGVVGSDLAIAALPVEDGDGLIAALEATASALWQAHHEGEEAAIESAWQVWLLANTRYVAWSDAQPRGTGRAMDRLMAERLRACEREWRVAP